MGVSISKIAVQVDGHTQGLTAAMRQGAQSIDMLTMASSRSARQSMAFGAAGNKSQVAMQQLAFAAEDAAISFSTGGFQGALRGASNNLSMVAMTLGGVRAQMLAIAGIAATQFAPTIMRAFGLVDDTVKDFGRSISRIDAQISNLKQTAQMRFDAGGMDARVDQLKTVAEAETRFAELDGKLNQTRTVDRGSEETRLRTLQKLLDDQRNGIENRNWADFFKEKPDLGQVEAAVSDAQSNLRRINEEILTIDRERMGVLERISQLVTDEGRNRRAVADNAARQKSAEVSKSLSKELRKELLSGPENAIADILDTVDARMKEVRSVEDGAQRRLLESSIAESAMKQLDELRGESLPTTDTGRFTMFAEASSRGSSAAVSTINAGLAGPGNLRDSAAVQKQSLDVLTKIERAETRIQAVLERTERNGGLVMVPVN